MRPQDLQGDDGLVLSFWADVHRASDDYRRTVVNGKPYLAVFLEHTSFVWTGHTTDPIEVEPGGHGERVQYLIHIPPEHPLVSNEWRSTTPIPTLLGFFSAVCMEFLRAQTEEDLT